MDEQDYNDLIESGKINSRARELGASKIKEGAKIVDVLDDVEQFIQDQGAGCAFPAQISLNAIAAHFCPLADDETSLAKGDVAKIDIGVHLNGWVSDSAKTVSVGGGNEDLIEASKLALKNAGKRLAIGVEVRDIGREIEDAITSKGFRPVKNLSGHGIGKYVVHRPPSMANYDNKDTTKLEDGMMIAIEPFASSGAGRVEGKGEAGVFQLSRKKPVRNMITRKVLGEILKFNGLPFTTRWLTRKFSLPQVNYALRDLHQHGVLMLHPPLVDIDNGLVSQAEHSFLIGEEVVCLTK